MRVLSGRTRTYQGYRDLGGLRVAAYSVQGLGLRGLGFGSWGCQGLGAGLGAYLTAASSEGLGLEWETRS